LEVLENCPTNNITMIDILNQFSFINFFILLILIINKTPQKRSPVGGDPFGSPNALSGKDYSHSTDQKTAFVRIDLNHTPNKKPEG